MKKEDKMTLAKIWDLLELLTKAGTRPQSVSLYINQILNPNEIN